MGLHEGGRVSWRTATGLALAAMLAVAAGCSPAANPASAVLPPGANDEEISDGGRCPLINFGTSQRPRWMKDPACSDN